MLDLFGSRATSLTGSVGRNGKNLPADVRLVQELLNLNVRPPYALLPLDGIASVNTVRMIEEFQRRVVKLSQPDGRIDVNGMTWKALIATKPSSPFAATPWLPTSFGASQVKPATPSAAQKITDPTWFPKQNLSAKGEKWARTTFGDFDYTPKPATKPKQEITILGTWKSDNIVSVDVPQLKGVATYGGQMGSSVKFHKLAAKQLQALWAAWQAAGLLNLVKFWDGGFYPRYQTGSTTKLSNHSWGTAFDINATWNGYNKQPAAIGQTGCLLPLVPIAEQHGFAWGGFFPSKDGMHFEVAELK
jgi:hypothetical protein